MRETPILRFVGALALLMSLSALAASPAIARGGGHVNFFLGGKALDEDDWEPVEDQAELGVELTFGGDWPIQIAIDGFYSSGEEEESGLDLDAYTAELGVGVRKVWEAGRARPYIGGGIAGIRAELEAEIELFDPILGFITVEAEDDDVGVGGWVGGGIFWRLGSAFNIGLSARYSSAEVKLFDEDFAGGGFHGGLLLGWGWE